MSGTSGVVSAVGDRSPADYDGLVAGFADATGRQLPLVCTLNGARNLVAINKDPDANIFKHARYGVVGDWKLVLPAFTAKVKELRGS